MDVLSDVLSVIRLTGGCFFTAEFSAPWSTFSPPAPELARLMATRTESVSLFHILVDGACWVSLEGHEPVPLTAGSVIIFPHSPSHNMGSDPALPPEPIVSLLRFSEEKEIPEIKYGGAGESTRLVCGYLQCDHRFNPLIGALPPMLVVAPSREGSSAETHSPVLPTVRLSDGDWLDKTLRHTVDEALKNQPGCAAMLARLTELIYVEVLRRYMQQLPADESGWLAAVNDPQVGRVLRCLHAEPKRKWTVDELARSVGLSRSALAGRFVELVGEPPIRYLTNWRMQRAKDLVLQADLSQSQIAEAVGYESEVAFNRAFKRHVGAPPTTWRQQFLAGAA